MTLQPISTIYLSAPAAEAITTELRTADHSRGTGGILKFHPVRGQRVVTLRG
jgi:hypothetical protein